MKKNILKGILGVSILSTLLLTGCGNAKTNHEFKIGISQFTEHPALDNARLGFEEGIKELGIDAEVIVKNAHADIPNTMSITNKFISDKTDLIFAIATPAAQSAKQATNSLPIVFSAVTDPVQAELVDSMEIPGGNITGTSDLSPIEKQLKLFKELDPTIKKIGIIFNTGEPNSQVQVDLASEIAKDLDLEIVTTGISKMSDMAQAVDSIIPKVDAIYTITDNMVASAINLVAEKATENGLITIGAESAHVEGGILMTDGISYFELGKQSARMAKEILVDKKDPSTFSCETSINTEKVLNEDTLNKLNLDGNHKAFKDAKTIK